MSEWKPIETAPIETDVLIYGNGLICVSKKEIWWEGHKGCWEVVGVCGDDWDNKITHPTHWMELPEAPK